MVLTEKGDYYIESYSAAGKLIELRAFDSFPVKMMGYEESGIYLIIITYNKKKIAYGKIIVK